MCGSRLQSLLRLSANKSAAAKIQLDIMVAQFEKVDRRIVFGVGPNSSGGSRESPGTLTKTL